MHRAALCAVCMPVWISSHSSKTQILGSFLDPKFDVNILALRPVMLHRVQD